MKTASKSWPGYGSPAPRAKATLRDHALDSPLGKLDAYEWILFIGAHSERHSKQIKEVIADPNFPKQ